eukprot:1014500-Pelagomonas_calceolata.AAC.2
MRTQHLKVKFTQPSNKVMCTQQQLKGSSHVHTTAQSLQHKGCCALTSQGYTPWASLVFLQIHERAQWPVLHHTHLFPGALGSHCANCKFHAHLRPLYDSCCPVYTCVHVYHCRCPIFAGAAAQPGSAAQSRPSSGTPAPVTPSPSHPSTPGPPAAAVAAASPDSVGVAGVQDPSQSQPLPQQQQQQYIAYMQQQQEQQGQHHHRQGRAESWDELAASRAMNQIATDLISLDEDDAGEARKVHLLISSWLFRS